MAEPDGLEHVPIGDVFPGVRLAQLPTGCVAETVFVFTKVRFDDETTAWRWLSPGITNQEELLGALIMQVEMLKTQMLEYWE